MEEKVVPVFNDGAVNTALTRIANTLDFSLLNKYNIKDKEITNNFLKMHGLDKDHFDFINNFENLIENGIADNSVDTNANKSDVSITGLFAETAMPINKLVGYRYLYRKMKDMYGKKRAKFLSGEMYDMSLAIADSSSILKPYCFSVNASKLVYEGRPWGSLPSAPPHRVNSYIAGLNETIHQLSNHLAGAIAVGSFFLDIVHMIIYREHRTLSDLLNNNIKYEGSISYRKYIENSLQSFIHSVNHLSRNSVESPFTNISIFDKSKLKSILAEDNMSWYFSENDMMDGIPHEALTDYQSNYKDISWIDYVIKLIIEIENIYMEIIDRGDPTHNNRPFTFPVSTINVSREKLPNGNFEPVDKQFLKDFCMKHDVFRYNIYISDGMKVASCCFAPTQKVKVRIDGSPEEDITFKDLSNRTYQKLEAYNPLEDKWVEVEFTKEFKIVKMKNIVLADDSNILCTYDHIFPIYDYNPLTDSFQVVYKQAQNINIETNYLFQVDGKEAHPIAIKKIEEGIQTGDDLNVYCLNYKDTSIPHDERTFILSNRIITTNCRLINDSELFELGGQVNSFGGTALSLGSHRVVTINMRRIALECNGVEDYKIKLKERMDSAADILIAHKSLLKELVDKKVQPFMSNGWLPLEKMFSTFGIMGYYEAAHDLMKRYGGTYEQYINMMIATIDSYARELSLQRKNVFNIEEIPGETMSFRLANCDRWIFGEEKVPEKIYANQFVPLWEDVTLEERFKGEGTFSSRLTGGGIIHFSLGEKLTSKQSMYVIEKALKYGVEHFALNPVYSICEDDHYTFGKSSICPVCGKPIKDYLTRTVGFFVKVSNMAKPKREEDFEKRHYRNI